MPFSLEAITSIKSVPAGGRIHVIGVCGVAMAQLAMMLDRRGFKVSGSDKEFYEPMAGLLRSSKVAIRQGYAAANLDASMDLVIIGNAVSRENDEVCAVEKLGLKYSIFPQILNELIIADKRSIVVSGTHGKTTTTAMTAYCLEAMGLQPSYFIGGAVLDLGSSLCDGAGRCSVVEGDEYDSAFFAKVPKFDFYRADALILTSLEHDHADIYPDFAAVSRVFHRKLAGLPDGSTVVACTDDPNVVELLNKLQREGGGRFGLISYGFNAQASCVILDCREVGNYQEVACRLPQGEQVSFRLKIPGAHNARNAAACIAALSCFGLDAEEACSKLANFNGVARRQQVIFEKPFVLIEDFAHHPSAVRETIAAMRARYPGRELWAVFEPRSNTSRRKVFFDQYVTAFKQASKAVLCQVTNRESDKAQELLNVPQLAEGIRKIGTEAESFPNSDAILEYLVKEVPENTVVLVMSNGAFGGLIGKLRQRAGKELSADLI